MLERGPCRHRLWRGLVAHVLDIHSQRLRDHLAQPLLLLYGHCCSALLLSAYGISPVSTRIQAGNGRAAPGPSRRNSHRHASAASASAPIGSKPCLAKRSAAGAFLAVGRKTPRSRVAPAARASPATKAIRASSTPRPSTRHDRR